MRLVRLYAAREKLNEKLARIEDQISRREDVLTFYAAGMALSEIGNAVDMHPACVRHVVLAEGIYKPHPSNNATSN